MNTETSFINQTKVDQIQLITKALNRKTSYLLNDCTEKCWYGVYVVNHKVIAIRCFHSEWMATKWIQVKEWIHRKDCKKHVKSTKRGH